MTKLLSIVTGLLFASCATNYHNGVSTWNNENQMDEVLETREYETYVVVEEDVDHNVAVNTVPMESAPQSLSSVSSVIVEDNTLDQINLVSSSTRSAESFVQPRLTEYNTISQAEYDLYKANSVTNVDSIVPAGSMGLTRTTRTRSGKYHLYNGGNYDLKNGKSVPQVQYEYINVPAKYKWVRSSAMLGDDSKVRVLVSPAQRLKRVIPVGYTVECSRGNCLSN